MKTATSSSKNNFVDLQLNYRSCSLEDAGVQLLKTIINVFCKAYKEDKYSYQSHKVIFRSLFSLAPEHTYIGEKDSRGITLKP